VNTSFRTTTSVIALTIASLAVPSLAFAKRMGSGGRTMPTARAGNAPVAPVAAKAPAPAAAPAVTAAPAVAAAPAARGPGLMGTMGAVAVGAVAGTMAGNALAGGTNSDKEAKAKEAEKEAQELQQKADEAKRKAEAARAAAK
jgi:hypothetical protein